MKWFEFRQNNSGGSFVKDMGLSFWVQANSPDEANILAEEHGVYFDGCVTGTDCACCGDRWSSLWRAEKGEDSPRDNGKYAKSWGLEDMVLPYGAKEKMSYKEWSIARGTATE